MPDQTNNPTGTPESNIPGTTGGHVSPGPRESLQSSKEHLREAADTLRSNLETSKSHVKQAAEDLRAAAEAKAQELRGRAEAKAGELRERAEHAYSDARARVRTLQDDGEEYIRHNPMKAVGTALVAGFILGMMIRR